MNLANGIKPSFLLLFMLIAFASINAVLFTPALPIIGQYFAVGENIVGLTISLFLVGYTIGQLFYGPLANRYGRKVALYIGIIMQIFACFICVLSAPLHSFYLFLIGRCFMALGSGVGLKMSFTLVADTYEQTEATKRIAKLIVAFAVMPGLGVTIGGYLVQHISWQSCFYFLAIYGLILLFGVSRMAETAKSLDKEALKLRKIFSKYLETLKNTRLITCGLLMGCGTAIIYLFAALAPFISINTMRLSPSAYGLWSFLPPMGTFLGSTIASYCAKRVSPQKAIVIGLIFMALGITVLMTAFLLHYLWPIVLFAPMVVIYTGSGIVYANASGLAMASSEDKSSASAMMSFLNMGTATIWVLLLPLLPTGYLLTPILYVVIMLVALGLGLKLKTSASLAFQK